jgi:hypothetical protein
MQLEPVVMSAWIGIDLRSEARGQRGPHGRFAHPFAGRHACSRRHCRNRTRPYYVDSGCVGGLRSTHSARDCELVHDGKYREPLLGGHRYFLGVSFATGGFYTQRWADNVSPCLPGLVVGNSNTPGKYSRYGTVTGSAQYFGPEAPASMVANSTGFRVGNKRTG